MASRVPPASWMPSTRRQLASGSGGSCTSSCTWLTSQPRPMTSTAAYIGVDRVAAAACGAGSRYASPVPAMPQPVPWVTATTPSTPAGQRAAARHECRSMAFADRGRAVDAGSTSASARADAADRAAIAVEVRSGGREAAWHGSRAHRHGPAAAGPDVEVSARGRARQPRWRAWPGDDLAVHARPHQGDVAQRELVAGGHGLARPSSHRPAPALP